MAAEDRGLLLWKEAYDIIQARLSTPAADYHRLAQNKAVEISDFLSQEGESLDHSRPDIVTNLGKAVDALASGVQDTLPAIKPSPIAEGIEHFINDDTSLDEEVSLQVDHLIDAAKKKAKDLIPDPPGGWKPWLIGGGVLAVVVGVGYTVRAFK